MQRLAPSFPLRAAQALSGLPAAKRPALWLADRLADAAATAAVRPSGFAALDAELPGGGWPASGLTELLFSAPGSGELRLLAPLLAQGPQEGLHAGRLLCVAPPFLPYAPALQTLAWPLERLLLVQPASLADAAWAAEQALRSGACSAVLWWQADERTSAAALTTALRRLHLAAQDSQCPLFALRPASARAQSSPAPLRLLLEPAAQGSTAHTGAPLKYFTEPIRSALYRRIDRTPSDPIRDGRIDYGVRGRLIGDWFLSTLVKGPDNVGGGVGHSRSRSSTTT